MQQKAFLKQWNKSFKIEVCIRISQDTLLNWTKESRIWNKAQIAEEELDQTPSSLEFLICSSSLIIVNLQT